MDDAFTEGEIGCLWALLLLGWAFVKNIVVVIRNILRDAGNIIKNNWPFWAIGLFLAFTGLWVSLNQAIFYDGVNRLYSGGLSTLTPDVDPELKINNFHFYQIVEVAYAPPFVFANFVQYLGETYNSMIVYLREVIIQFVVMFLELNNAVQPLSWFDVVREIIYSTFAFINVLIWNTDLVIPALDGLYKGVIVWLECIALTAFDIGETMIRGTTISENCAMCDYYNGQPETCSFMEMSLDLVSFSTSAPNCSECQSLDCQWINCTLYIVKAALNPILVPCFGYNIGPFIDTWAFFSCCAIRSAIYRPFFYLLAFFENLFLGTCFGISELAFQLSEWFWDIQECWNFLICFLTEGEYCTLFEFVVDFLFPQIGLVLEAVVAVVECADQPEASACLSAWPGNCPDGGLFGTDPNGCFTDIIECMENNSTLWNSISGYFDIVLVVGEFFEFFVCGVECAVGDPVETCLDNIALDPLFACENDTGINYCYDQWELCASQYLFYQTFSGLFGAIGGFLDFVDNSLCFPIEYVTCVNDETQNCNIGTCGFNFTCWAENCFEPFFTCINVGGVFYMSGGECQYTKYNRQLECSDSMPLKKLGRINQFVASVDTTAKWGTYGLSVAWEHRKQISAFLTHWGFYSGTWSGFSSEMALRSCITQASDLLQGSDTGYDPCVNFCWYNPGICIRSMSKEELLTRTSKLDRLELTDAAQIASESCGGLPPLFVPESYGMVKGVTSFVMTSEAEKFSIIQKVACMQGVYLKEAGPVQLPKISQDISNYVSAVDFGKLSAAFIKWEIAKATKLALGTSTGDCAVSVLDSDNESYVVDLTEDLFNSDPESFQAALQQNVPHLVTGFQEKTKDFLDRATFAVKSTMLHLKERLRGTRNTILSDFSNIDWCQLRQDDVIVIQDTRSAKNFKYSATELCYCSESEFNGLQDNYRITRGGDVDCGDFRKYVLEMLTLNFYGAKYEQADMTGGFSRKTKKNMFRGIDGLLRNIQMDAQRKDAAIHRLFVPKNNGRRNTMAFLIGGEEAMAAFRENRGHICDSPCDDPHAITLSPNVTEVPHVGSIQSLQNPYCWISGDPYSPPTETSEEKSTMDFLGIMHEKTKHIPSGHNATLTVAKNLLKNHPGVAENRLIKGVHMVVSSALNGQVANIPKWFKGELEFTMTNGWVPAPIDPPRPNGSVWETEEVVNLGIFIIGVDLACLFISDCSTPVTEPLPQTCESGNIHACRKENNMQRFDSGTPMFQESKFTFTRARLGVFTTSSLFGNPADFDANEWLDDFIQTIISVSIGLATDWLTQFIEDAFNWILDIDITNVWDSFISFINGPTSCMYPIDVNGTNVYNPFCAPLIAEAVAFGLEPLPTPNLKPQIPWPRILLEDECDNPDYSRRWFPDISQGFVPRNEQGFRAWRQFWKDFLSDVCGVESGYGSAVEIMEGDDYCWVLIGGKSNGPQEKLWGTVQVRDCTTMNLLQTLEANNKDQMEFFGFSIDCLNETCYVGATLGDKHLGHVVVFERMYNGTIGAYQLVGKQTIGNPDTVANIFFNAQLFGHTVVAISDLEIAIAAPVANFSQGEIDIYRRDTVNDDFALAQILVDDSGAIWSLLGFSLASTYTASDDRYWLFAGEPSWEDFPLGKLVGLIGRIVVFYRESSSSTWEPYGTLNIDNTDEADRFGFASDCYDDLCCFSDIVFNATGRVICYQHNGTDWVQVADLFGENGSQFGYGISISETQIMISGPVFSSIWFFAKTPGYPLNARVDFFPTKEYDCEVANVAISTGDDVWVAACDTANTFNLTGSGVAYINPTGSYDRSDAVKFLPNSEKSSFRPFCPENDLCPANFTEEGCNAVIGDFLDWTFFLNAWVPEVMNTIFIDGIKLQPFRELFTRAFYLVPMVMLFSLPIFWPTALVGLSIVFGFLQGGQIVIWFLYTVWGDGIPIAPIAFILYVLYRALVPGNWQIIVKSIIQPAGISMFQIAMLILLLLQLAYIVINYVAIDFSLNQEAADFLKGVDDTLLGKLIPGLDIIIYKLERYVYPDNVIPAGDTFCFFVGFRNFGYAITGLAILIPFLPYARETFRAIAVLVTSALFIILYSIVIFAYNLLALYAPENSP